VPPLGNLGDLGLTMTLLNIVNAHAGRIHALNPRCIVAIYPETRDNHSGTVVEFCDGNRSGSVYTKENVYEVLARLEKLP
jgi:hypothetical protein